MKSIGEALSLISRLGYFDVISISMDNNSKSVHHINHRYREHIIVPYLAISDNIKFATNKGERYISFSDGVIAKVIEATEQHICQLEEKVQKLYGIDVWTFIKKWYSAYKQMDSMHFIEIKVRKEE